MTTGCGAGRLVGPDAGDCSDESCTLLPSRLLWERSHGVAFGCSDSALYWWAEAPGRKLRVRRRLYGVSCEVLCRHREY